MPKLRYLIIAVTNGTHAFMKLLYYLLFYRTKPTGRGTGLRLSMAYDIVKAHGGELKIESKEGEGATFTIGLPFLQN
jgi:signal transduction histidine kinase